MKIADKLIKINDSFNIYMYDNGFMLEICGRNADDEWANAKIMVTNVDDLTELVHEASKMPRE